jgi:hypothetical protein
MHRRVHHRDKDNAHWPVEIGLNLSYFEKEERPPLVVFFGEAPEEVRDRQTRRLTTVLNLGEQVCLEECPGGLFGRTGTPKR